MQRGQYDILDIDQQTGIKTQKNCEFVILVHDYKRVIWMKNFPLKDGKMYSILLI